ncbi:hypothetical protein DEU56DRAFT_913818 [Suillus clintonianus]|uniref:uncharacterized protein n=1 Tax=Suillus clintonianus TaxID=1904413 RepID=UPI001B87F355|nr:uncharacterized protein DEU56DRAFT_913818 [Suillus clintonianus]KAG2133698.1 hypothetical protein DEU56DRAFT_913818 [Suillus clintonianus]
MFPTLPVLASAVAKISTPFRRSQLGLFHGKIKQYGNNVPHSKHKTRRTWLPNVQTKRLKSDALGHDVKVKLTTRALKTINKHGGVDNYLLRTKPDLLGIEGMRLRILVREKLDVKRVEDEAAAAAQAEEEARIQLVKEMKEEKQRRRAKVAHARKSREVRQNITSGIFGSTASSTARPTAS